MITKEQALKNYKEATLQLRQRMNPEHGLTDEQRAAMAANGMAQAELIEARAFLESSLGTPDESAALERLQKAESLAPLRAKMAAPAKDAWRVIRDQTIRESEKLRDHQRQAWNDLCFFASEELVEKMDLEAITKALQRAYALRANSQQGSTSWANWLETVFTFPARSDWNPILKEAGEHLASVLAKEVAK